MAAPPIDSDFRFQVIAEHAADWQFWIREDGSVEYISPACERISGFSREGLASGEVRLRDYVHPEDFPMMKGHYLAALAGKEGHDIEFRITRRDGGIRWGSLSFVPVRDGEGRHYGFRGSIRDITERVESKEAIRRERNLLDKVVSSIGAGLAILDREHRIVWYNAVHKSYFGPLAENRGKFCYHVFEKSPVICNGCPVAEAYAKGVPSQSERIGISVQNEARDFLVYATPLAGTGGSFDQCVELVIDITEERARKAERERLREQLLQAQKMEAIGTLAGGVAHEFNNLLTGILGFTSLLQARAGAEVPPGHPLAMIEKTATRAADLTKQLLGFARMETISMQAVRLNEVAGEVLSIIRQTFDRSIVIRDELDPGLWPVEGDPGQLAQALLNISINARDAIGRGGTITIRTANLDGERDGAAPWNGLGPGRYVALSVHDTGSGIPSAIRDRIFEPFFTTKEPGKGTGMGLALVYGTVQEHGGAVSVDSEPGAGTTFRIFLPAKEG